MRFLAATTTRAVSADASVAFDTTPATRRTLAITLVARSDAATVQLAPTSVCHLFSPCLAAVESFRGEVLRAVAVHAITVFRAVFWSAAILSASNGVVPVI